MAKETFILKLSNIQFTSLKCPSQLQLCFFYNILYAFSSWDMNRFKQITSPIIILYNIQKKLCIILLNYTQNCQIFPLVVSCFNFFFRHIVLSDFPSVIWVCHLYCLVRKRSTLKTYTLLCLYMSSPKGFTLTVTLISALY